MNFWLAGRAVGSAAGVTLALCLVVSAASAQNAAETSGIDLGVSAKPVTRKAPKYPQGELSRGRQGWVELSFVVDTDGNVVDPVVVDSSGSREFERAALRTLDRWKYEPATWNGKPVQQCETKTLITFAIEGDETKVSQPFFRRYRSIKKALDKSDVLRAAELIGKARTQLKLTLADMAWLSSLEARLAGLKGDKEAQLEAVRNATRGSGRWIDDKLFPNLLYVRTALELEQGNYAQSLSAYEKLHAVDPDSEHLGKLEPHIERIRSVIDSELALRVNATIDQTAQCLDCNKRWHHEPVRRAFSLTDVHGELGNIEFRCERRRVVAAAQEGLTWQLPESFGNCSIVVHGKPGTTFDLIELPTA